MDYKNNVGRFVGRIHNLMTKRLNLFYKESEVGITAEQFRLFTHLWESDGISQQQLCAPLNRDKAAVTRMVDILEKEGYIKRESDASDRRINLLFLTKKGKDIERESTKCVEKVLKLAVQNFSQKEKEELERLLKKMIQNLDK